MDNSMFSMRNLLCFSIWLMVFEAKAEVANNVHLRFTTHADYFRDF
jgi:hypothetical protein